VRILLLLLLASNSYSLGEIENIMDIPCGSKFRINMKDVISKRNKCLSGEKRYRLKDDINLVNGSLECNAPIFERSCHITIDTKFKYPPSVDCTLVNKEIDPHYVELQFDEVNCPKLSCRPFMFTGAFTGADIGIKSLKYNVGKYVDFKIEKGINLDPRSPLDKEPDHMNNSSNKFKSNKALKK